MNENTENSEALTAGASIFCFPGGLVILHLAGEHPYFLSDAEARSLYADLKAHFEVARAGVGRPRLPDEALTAKGASSRRYRDRKKAGLPALRKRKQKLAEGLVDCVSIENEAIALVDGLRQYVEAHKGEQ